jgi:hypothetical protein
MKLLFLCCSVGILCMGKTPAPSGKLRGRSYSGGLHSLDLAWGADLYVSYPFTAVKLSITDAIML